MKFWVSVLALLLALVSFQADAAPRRLGGGGSIGRQSSNVTQSPRSTPQQAPSPPAGPQSVRPPRPWGGMLGGLAAGLGLAWLAHSLGLGEAFGQFLVVLLFVMLAMMVAGWMMRSRRAQPAWSGPAPADTARPPPQYSPDKVGNDASARPWERAGMALEAGKYPSATGGLQIGSALGVHSTWGIPENFDVEGFVATARRNFVTLQQAWDRADLITLRSMMTDEMLGEIKSQLAEREKQLSGQPNHTDVVMLQAQLLGIEDLGGDYMASVEFSGMIREEPSAGPTPFREVWNMTKPKSGASGWLVAGVQALQ